MVNGCSAVDWVKSITLTFLFETYQIESYTPDDYEPDYLTLFLYEIKSGNMKFETVNGVKFHFFQIEDWYFEVSQFNRPGFNTGWLMSNLTKVDNEEEKQAILNYIYDQK